MQLELVSKLSQYNDSLVELSTYSISKQEVEIADI